MVPRIYRPPLEAVQTLPMRPAPPSRVEPSGQPHSCSSWSGTGEYSPAISGDFAPVFCWLKLAFSIFHLAVYCAFVCGVLWVKNYFTAVSIGKGGPHRSQEGTKVPP